MAAGISFGNFYDYENWYMQSVINNDVTIRVYELKIIKGDNIEIF